jgi:hypothetical protein
MYVSSRDVKNINSIIDRLFNSIPFQKPYYSHIKNKREHTFSIDKRKSSGIFIK